jgi:hypothetical protein
MVVSSNPVISWLHIGVHSIHITILVFLVVCSSKSLNSTFVNIITFNHQSSLGSGCPQRKNLFRFAKYSWSAIAFQFTVLEIAFDSSSYFHIFANLLFLYLSLLLIQDIVSSREIKIAWHVNIQQMYMRHEEQGNLEEIRDQMLHKGITILTYSQNLVQS